jgi:hypothetical protein
MKGYVGGLASHVFVRITAFQDAGGPQKVGVRQFEVTSESGVELWTPYQRMLFIFDQ